MAVMRHFAESNKAKKLLLEREGEGKRERRGGS
jgi:hypothetical protein